MDERLLKRLNRSEQKIIGFLQGRHISEARDEIRRFEDLLDEIPQNNAQIEQEYEQKVKQFNDAVELVLGNVKDEIPSWNRDFEKFPEYVENVLKFCHTVLHRIHQSDQEKKRILATALPQPFNNWTLKLSMDNIKQIFAFMENRIKAAIELYNKHFKNIDWTKLLTKLDALLRNPPQVAHKLLNKCNLDSLTEVLVEYTKNCFKTHTIYNLIKDNYSKICSEIQETIPASLYPFLPPIIVELSVAFNKHEQSLMTTIDFARNQLYRILQSNSKLLASTSFTTEQTQLFKGINWSLHQSVSILIVFLFVELKKRDVQLKTENQNKIRKYLLELLDLCDHDKTMETVAVALNYFSLNDDLLGTKLLKQIITLTSDLADKNETMLKHRNLGHLLFVMATTTQLEGPNLQFFQNDNFQSIVNFQVKVLQCSNIDDFTVDWAICSFKHSPDVAWAEIGKLIESPNTSQNNLKWHEKLCKVLTSFSTISITIDRENGGKIFDYLTKLFFTDETEQHLPIELFPVNVVAKIDSFQNFLSYTIDIVTSKSSQANLCIVIDKVLEIISNDTKLSDQIRDKIFNFAERQINKRASFETIFCAIKVLRGLCLIENESDKIERARKQLEKCIQNVPIPNVNWWVKVFVLHKVLSEKSNLIETELLNAPFELSHDRLYARNAKSFPSVTTISQFSVISEMYYYEVIILSNGKLQIGWTTLESVWDVEFGIGTDQHSIGLDVSKNVCVMHAKQNCAELSNQLNSWKIGDIVGCLIDFQTKKFTFFLNGLQIDCRENVHFSSLPYYPAASLSTNQECYFNFGQIPFRHNKPDGAQSFNKDTNYQLLFPNITTNFESYFYWFKHPLIDDRVQPFYRDQIQEKCDQFMLEQMKNWKQIKDENYSITRCLQSVIEILDNEQCNDHGHNETTIFQIDSLISVDRLSKLKFDDDTFQKHLEIIYPYTLLKINRENVKKHRVVSFILSRINSALLGLFLNLHHYFIQILSNSTDQWTLMYTLFCIENLTKNKIIGIEKINIKEILDRILDRARSKFDGKNICCLMYDRTKHLDYRLYVVAQWFRDHTLMHPNSTIETSSSAIDKVPAKLVNISGDEKFRLIFSQDLLSVCSHKSYELDLIMYSFWKSARSVGAVCIGSIDPKPIACYFEVILLTGGEMRIGWAAKFCESDIILGENEYSVCFDGFNQAVFHEGKPYNTSSCDDQKWKAGDVIGCLLDGSNIHKKSNRNESTKFGFYLNGEEVKFEVNYYFSSQPYYAAVSLLGDQQCYFNFGPKFKYPPKRIDYQPFCAVAKVIEDGTQSSTPVSQNITKIHIENTNLQDVLLNVNSKVECHNINLKSSSSTFNIDNKTIDLKTINRVQNVDDKSEKQIEEDSAQKEKS